MMMNSTSYIKWYERSLALLVFLMLVTPQLVGLGIVIFVGLWVVGLSKKFLIFRLNWLNTALFLLYIAYAAGVLFTNHADVASRYLEYKLSLIIFPLLFSFPTKKISLRIPAIVLILSVTALFCIGLVNGAILYNGLHELAYFQSSYFSIIHHPTYLSVYAVLGLGLLIYGCQNRWRFFTKKNAFLFGSILILTQVLSMSLSGLLFLILFASVLILYLLKKKFGKTFFIATLIAMPLVFILTVKFVPGINTQFKNASDYLVEFINDPEAFYKNKQTYVGGSETRLIMWSAAAQVFIEHPLGVGTGNVDDFLSEKLVHIGQPSMAKKLYNPHNQFLQTGVEIGVIGLFILLFIIGYGVYYSFKTKNWLLLLLITNLAFNCLFESMLQRQSGIVFYTFWIGLLCVSTSQIQNKPLR